MRLPPAFLSFFLSRSQMSALTIYHAPQSRLCIPDLREVEAFEPSQSHVNNRCTRTDPTRRPVRPADLANLAAHAQRKSRGPLCQFPERSVKSRRASSAEFEALRGAGVARDLRGEDDQLEPDLRAEYARSKWSAFGALEICERNSPTVT